MPNNWNNKSNKFESLIEGKINERNSSDQSFIDAEINVLIS